MLVVCCTSSSHSVAVDIKFIARLKGNNASTLDTAAFLETFNQLFNTFNRRNIKSHQNMGHAVQEDSGHAEVLEETLRWLDTIKSSKFDGMENGHLHFVISLG